MNDFDFAYFVTTHVDGREAQSRFMEFAAVIWDEGFDAGHYVEGESKTCDCRKNPYRKDDV